MEQHIQPQTTFMNLPAEMRLKIYSFLLPSRIPISEFRRHSYKYDEGDDRKILLDMNEYEFNVPETELPRFLLTSKIIYDEARPLFIRQLVFDKVGEDGLGTRNDNNYYKSLVQRRSTIWLLNLKQVQHIIVERLEFPHPTMDTPSIPNSKPLASGERRQVIESRFPHLKTVTAGSRYPFFVHPQAFHVHWVSTMRRGEPCNLLSVMRQTFRAEIEHRMTKGGGDYIDALNQLAKRYQTIVEIPEYHAHIYADAENGRLEQAATMECTWDWNDDKLKIDIRSDREMRSCPNSCRHALYSCQQRRSLTNKWLRPERVWDELPKHNPEYPWDSHRGELVMDVVIFKELGQKDVVYLEG